MISNQDAENGTASATSVSGRASADAGRTPAESTDAKRKREARAKKREQGSTETSGRPSGNPKGNPTGFSNVIPVHMGESLSPAEAKRQLYWGHVGLAKAVRSDIDLSTLDEEFEVAGENYSYVANHMFPILRVVIRFIAPVVLVAVLIMIWGSILAQTPWIHHIRDWWQRRSSSSESEPQTPPYVAPDASRPAEAAAAASFQQPPPLPRRPTIRTVGGFRR